MFKVLVHGCQEARCKPLIHVIQTSNRSLIFTQELAFYRYERSFALRKPIGVFFVALKNVFEALDHTLVQGISTFPPNVSDFIIITTIIIIIIINLYSILIKKTYVQCST